MKPLDLTKAPPRSPRRQLDGLDMMPRTIDKLRASLPGGNMGEYKIAGSSQRLLDFIGIDAGELRDAIARAEDEAAVARWLAERVPRDLYAKANAALTTRRLRDVDDLPALRSRYPIARDLSDDTPLYDLLELDDKALFPQR
ncbi:MAG TPA: DUF5069 domain-containing protein [Candidatus Baltobacteraceae bacterium]|jgi:hypothetical protein|nr:DUF5069 domain-containing protein [Candidatus Baltobacteraceae bacterium]